MSIIFFGRLDFSVAFQSAFQTYWTKLIEPCIELKVENTLAEPVLLRDPLYKQNHLST